jgi:hypothetical protein
MPVPFEPRFVDLVRNLSTTSGTGNFVLGAAVSGFTSFVPAIVAGESFYYSAIGIDKPAEREIGRGTMQSNGTISREPISGSLTNFTAGAKSIALIAAAEWFNAVQGASGSGGNGSAASRAALAALTAQQSPVVLLEAGREGLFIFDSANLTARVSADSAQGIYVAPSSSPSGASGAWVRKYSGPLDIRWFGGVANSTALSGGVFNGTDNSAAVNAARAVAALTLGGAIHFPQGSGGYRFASKHTLTGGIAITGDGWHENPGSVGGNTYVGIQQYPGSVLCFDADVGGFQFIAYTDNNANATAFEYQSSIGSIIRDIMLYGGGGTGTGAHGIESRTCLNMDNVRIENFAGSGLRIIASASGAVPYGSSDCGSYRRVNCGFNRLHGLHVTGDDANVNHFDTCSAANNGGAGFLFPEGLGNAFTSCHAASNNQSHPSNIYAGNHSAGQRAQNIADWAGLSDPNAGSFVITGTAACNVLDDCYAEGGLGQKADIRPPSLVFGGNLASPVSHTTASTAARYNSSQIVNLGTIVADNSGVVDIQGGMLQASNAAGNPVFRLTGTGTYSYLQMYGAGVAASGLDILAGNTNAYLSADAFTFRNAAQATNFLALSAASAVFNGAVSGSNLSGTHSGASSGTNTGDQTITLTGDVTGSGTGSFAATIGANKVTFAKFVAASAASIVGATAAGNFAELTPASARSVLGLAAVATSGSASDITTGTLPVAQIAAFSGGDVTKAAGSGTLTIAANAVTFGKVVAASAASIVGATAAGNFAELTPASARTVLGLAAIATSGSGADLTAATVTYAKIQNVSATAKLLGRASAGAGVVEELGLAGGLAISGANLTLGALTPTSVAATGAITTSSPTAGNGYATGAGGAVTQATNKSTAVTLNTVCGAITMNGAALAASTNVTFTLTNSAIAATDVVVVAIKSGAATAGTYQAWVTATAAGSCTITVRNISAGSLSEALVLNFAINKAVAA